MIAARELFDLRAEWSLDVGVIEKDYVLGWLLAGIANHPEVAGTWVFKGGTCLRKCYYETYRFSEDLDFSVVDGGPEAPEDLLPIFGAIGEWVREESGIELVVEETAFRRRRNRRGNPTTQGRIAYRGPNPPPQLPKVTLDITADELVIEQVVLRAIGHQYSDTLPGDAVGCYARHPYRSRESSNHNPCVEIRSSAATTASGAYRRVAFVSSRSATRKTVAPRA